MAITPPGFSTAPRGLPAGGAGPQPTAQVIELGPIRAAPLAVVMEEERAAAQAVQAKPITQNLASHVRQMWTQARDAKNAIQERMLQNIRARRGEYDPEKKSAIAAMGGSDVYAGLTSVKCRAASGWIKDVLLSTGSERPWRVSPTQVPDLPPQITELVVQAAAGPIMQAQAMGVQMTDADVMEMVSNLRDQALAAAKQEANRRAERMGDKMEDQLQEGGFHRALDEFIDDITTFPSAILKGPVIRRKPKLTWGQDGKPQVTDEIAVEWERVSPFNIYPSPTATCVDDGFLIEKHQLSRTDLQDLIDVEGYDSSSIRTVLEEYGSGGLRDWLNDNIEQANAEGRTNTQENPEGLIDAIQFWGTVQGKWLIDNGMTEKEVPDPVREYHVEVWLIGSYVIKAVLNYDPLRRKPYYKASYEEVPGQWWGNSVADLVRDSQQIVNATARAIVNNMGIASGPQVSINVNRLPPGEQITQLTPWKIWQVQDDPLGGGTSRAPIEFFQPDSNVGELMGVFEKFSALADEYSGIPRYLTGDTTGGAGRTASGLSMLINNAGKSIKQVISNIDMSVMTPLLERLYYYNMRYSDDPELKGDVCVVARGSSALIAKEAAAVRRNEFLASTANPIDMQIVGVEGRAAILREVAKNLDMDVDKVIPPVEVLRQKWMAAQQAALGAPAEGAEQPGGAVGPSPSGQALMDGTPQTDNFGPPKANP